MALGERIEMNPKVMMGKPVIRGTRIPVELILRKLSEGATEDDLLDAYPRLSREDLAIAWTFTTQSVTEPMLSLRNAAYNPAAGLPATLGLL